LRTCWIISLSVAVWAKTRRAKRRTRIFFIWRLLIKLNIRPTNQHKINNHGYLLFDGYNSYNPQSKVYRIYINKKSTSFYLFDCKHKYVKYGLDIITLPFLDTIMLLEPVFLNYALFGDV